MDNSLLVNTLRSSSLATLLVFFLLWLCKKKIIGWFEKDVSKDIERYKHELDTKKELIKHDLSVEISKVRYHSESIQEIYPELYQSLVISEGSMSYFFYSYYSQDWNSISESELEKVLKSKEIQEAEIERLVSLVKTQSSDRSNEIKQALNVKYLYDVEETITKSKNYFLLKRLFVSSNIERQVSAIYKKKWSVWAGLETWYLFGKSTSGVKFSDLKKEYNEISEMVRELEEIMKNELFPS
ncbi:hypothetical protein BALOs_2741 [Halobacteriovorax sp. BALOs_7]|uniref:hypothetical protein n=1 Tax=Halobacteriovorax sp. BALOs_7 TaxID=2109558 RepID=UPI000EA08FE4|nr:hypothetical protein [Halobacteriovorax sp. BALOs_7]AYF45731.1 hypothetical protein BALOs_2741 [Halobacteriovorax sp. BALOs_7]